MKIVSLQISKEINDTDEINTNFIEENGWTIDNIDTISSNIKKWLITTSFDLDFNDDFLCYCAEDPLKSDKYKEVKNSLFEDLFMIYRDIFSELYRIGEITPESSIKAFETFKTYVAMRSEEITEKKWRLYPDDCYEILIDERIKNN